MGRGRKNILQDFIDEIPDSKLEGFPDTETTLYKDDNLRIDMQGVRNNHSSCLALPVC